MFSKVEIGLEKESLIFDKYTIPIDIPTDELKEGITKDYANHQLEFITDVYDEIDELYAKVTSLFNVLDIEAYAWPLSVPGDIHNVKVAELGSKKTEYRNYLKEKYSEDLMLLSGIHYNFSYGEEVLNNYFNKSKEDNYERFVTDFYFEIYKKLYMYTPILIFLNGFSPFYNKTFSNKYTQGLNTIGANLGTEYSVSLRNGLKNGYSNELEVIPCFKSYTEYLKSFDDYITNGMIKGLEEQYSKVRLKSSKGSIIDHGVDYLELRVVDNNPFVKTGITKDQIKFIRLIMIYLLFIENDLDDKNVREYINNFNQVSLFGLDESLKIYFKGEQILFNDFLLSTLEDMLRHSCFNEDDKSLIRDYIDKVSNYKNLNIFKMRTEIISNNLTMTEFGNKYLWRCDNV